MKWFASKISWQSSARERSPGGDRQLTCVLDAVLREHAVAPVRHAAHDLRTAGAAGARGRALVHWRRRRVVLILAEEALLVLVAHCVPAVEVRVRYEA